jgi:hypothetical protein
VNHKPFFISPRRLCPPTDPLFLVLHTLSVYLLQYNYYLMPLFTVLFYFILGFSAYHKVKNSAIRFLTNRMNTYPISANNKRKEEQQIETILVNNNYPQHIHKNKRKQNKNTTNNTKKKQWVTFTYTGKETRTIARLFRNTDVKIAYRTTNTIQNHLREKRQNSIYEKSGIYQLKCGGCQKKYVGQTGRNFQTRYKEHDRICGLVVRVLGYRS